MALIDTLEEVISAQSDEHFDTSTKEYYLNKAQDKVVSIAIKTEQEGRKSLRALDSLRKRSDSSVNGLTFTSISDYFSVEITAPSDMKQFIFLRYNNTTPLREISFDNLIKLDLGNITPDDSESYFTIYNNGVNNVFEVFVDSDDSATSNNVRVYYIADPSTIDNLTTSLAELPDSLENAVIYGAAYMMILQESTHDPDAQYESFHQLFQEEIQAGLY